jgi:hypothetical protein
MNSSFDGNFSNSESFNSSYNASNKNDIVNSNSSQRKWMQQETERRNAMMENHSRLLSRLVAISEEQNSAHGI